MAAQLALLAAQVTVWTRPVGQLVAPERAPGVPTPAGEVEPVARQLASAVNRAAAYGVFRPKCLVRAVALHRMMDARGLPGSRVCVGVRKHRGRFQAHAWIEYKSQVLGDQLSHVNTFAPLDDVRVMSNG